MNFTNVSTKNQNSKVNHTSTVYLLFSRQEKYGYSNPESPNYSVKLLKQDNSLKFMKISQSQ